MLVRRPSNNKTIPLNIVGSTKFGIYPKMSTEVTYNMTISDEWLVPYPGYKRAVFSEHFADATTGRGLYESVKLNAIYAVFDSRFYEVKLIYSHTQQKVLAHTVNLLGTLQTSSGVVHIAENNKPQILLSDDVNMYIYDPGLSTGSFTFTSDGTTTLTISQQVSLEEGEPIIFTGSPPANLLPNVTYYVADPEVTSTQTTFKVAASIQDIPTNTFITVAAGNPVLYVATNFFVVPLTFKPGYITFHDTYFIAAANEDTYYYPAANNTWRLSANNNGFAWFDIAQRIGLLETKPDNTKAVVRFPSKGNLILVMGETVTEFWYDTGAQLFPYQRNNQSSIDYGCASPATVAYMDELVVWLAKNEKSGPVIMYTTGGEPIKVTTDGIDFKLSEIETPEDSQAFLFRKNGHVFYHINFYSDNFSFVVDLTAQKIYSATDHNMNYYQMGQVVWYNNQYYSITKDNGYLFIFDTVFSTYDYILPNGNNEVVQIPRTRICDNIRLPNQDYFILNDIGFTIETGETNYQQTTTIPEGTTPINIIFQNGNQMQFQNENTAIYSEGEPLPGVTTYITPAIDLSISYDGGAAFSAPIRYVLNPIGKRRNRLMWWQLGVGNDCVPKFTYWGNGPWVATNGEANILI